LRHAISFCIIRAPRSDSCTTASRLARCNSAQTQHGLSFVPSAAALRCFGESRRSHRFGSLFPPQQRLHCSCSPPLYPFVTNTEPAFTRLFQARPPCCRVQLTRRLHSPLVAPSPLARAAPPFCCTRRAATALGARPPAPLWPFLATHLRNNSNATPLSEQTSLSRSFVALPQLTSTAFFRARGARRGLLVFAPPARFFASFLFSLPPCPWAPRRAVSFVSS